MILKYFMTKLFELKGFTLNNASGKVKKFIEIENNDIITKETNDNQFHTPIFNISLASKILKNW